MGEPVTGRAVDHGHQRRSGVGAAHGFPFVLVGVEQALGRPALDHPGELPAQVVAVGDPGVHAGRSARSGPVGGVSDQENPAAAIVLDHAGPEIPREDPDDLRVRDPAIRPPARMRAIMRSVVQSSIALAVLGMPFPCRRSTGAACAVEAKSPSHARCDGRPGVRTADRPARRQIPMEQHRQVMTFSRQHLELDPDQGADQAATAVGADQVAGGDLRDSDRCLDHAAWPPPRRAVWAIVNQLGAEADLAAAALPDVHTRRPRLDLDRSGRREPGCGRRARRRRQTEAELLPSGRSQRRLRPTSRAGRVASVGPDRGLETPAAEDLHAARADPDGLREDRQALVLLDRPARGPRSGPGRRRWSARTVRPPPRGRRSHESLSWSCAPRSAKDHGADPC